MGPKPGLTSPTGWFRSDTSGGGTVLHPLSKLPSSWALSLRRRRPGAGLRLPEVLASLPRSDSRFPGSFRGSRSSRGFGVGSLPPCVAGNAASPDFSLGSGTEATHRAQTSPLQSLPGLPGAQVTNVAGYSRTHDGLCVARNVDFPESVGQCVRTGMLTVTYVHWGSFSTSSHVRC